MTDSERDSATLAAAQDQRDDATLLLLRIAYRLELFELGRPVPTRQEVHETLVHWLEQPRAC